ncbi:MAG: HD-GYP domain-containing protein [Chloroflexi bacterium]|nr:MAG: HD-GYP domain-containing protein [Chloroflexota bacterium]
MGVVGDPWRSAHADELRLAVIMVVAVVVYHLSNKLLTAAIISLATGRRFGFLLRVNTRSTGLPELGAGALGSLLALLWTIHPAWTVLLAVPTAVITRTLRYVRQLEGETRSAVRSLAEVIDHRDPHTAHHSERVASYAVALARRLDLDEDVVELIDQAGSVHDLGKIGVADSILLKPGALTEGERNHYELFREGALIVLHHHERWDGGGYPAGLAGEAIPLGSRVVAVADAFDAMTSNRPYRAALSVAEAVGRLREGSGVQWDPDLVDVFIGLVAEGAIAPALASRDLAPSAAGIPARSSDPFPEVER